MPALGREHEVLADAYTDEMGRPSEPEISGVDRNHRRARPSAVALAGATSPVLQAAALQPE